MTDEDDDLPEALYEGTWIHWNCPHCGVINEDENDVRGQEVECDHCGGKSRVSN